MLRALDQENDNVIRDPAREVREVDRDRDSDFIMIFIAHLRRNSTPTASSAGKILRATWNTSTTRTEIRDSMRSNSGP